MKKELSFTEYQRVSRQTAIYPDKDNNWVYPALGLAGETGEIMEKLKKVLRDKGGVIDEEARETISKELGDVCWYLSQLATELNLSLGVIAESNLEKLFSRQRRGKLQGDGDER